MCITSNESIYFRFIFFYLDIFIGTWFMRIVVFILRCPICDESHFFRSMISIELKFQCRWRFAPAFIQMFWHLYNTICGTKKKDLNIVRHRQAWFIQIQSMKCWTYFHISFVEPRVHFIFHQIFVYFICVCILHCQTLQIGYTIDSDNAMIPLSTFSIWVIMCKMSFDDSILLWWKLCGYFVKYLFLFALIKRYSIKMYFKGR